MAAEAPSHLSLQTWQDAFKYPIPTTRRLEQELRRDVSSNQDKLRSLAGYVENVENIAVRCGCRGANELMVGLIDNNKKSSVPRPPFYRPEDRWHESTGAGCRGKHLQSRNAL